MSSSRQLRWHDNLTHNSQEQITVVHRAALNHSDNLPSCPQDSRVFSSIPRRGVSGNFCGEGEEQGTSWRARSGARAYSGRLWHMRQLQVIGVMRSSVYIGRRNVAVICGNDTISMLSGNTAYCVKLSGGDLSRYSNKIESVGLRRCSYYHYVSLTKKVMSQ